MLSIHLGADDLGRIRFANEPAPILETVLMLYELRNRPPRLGDRDDDWRARMRSTFPRAAAPLLNLVPSRQVALYFDVLTPDAEEAFHRVRSMPRSLVDHDLDRIARLNVIKVPTWLRRFSAGDPTVRQALDDGFRAFHRTCLAPHWDSVAARFHHDVAHRMTIARQHGLSAMLDTLSPDLRLNGLTIEGNYPGERHIHLDGHGLILIPSAFWTGYPLVTWDDQEPSRHVLIYPAGDAGGHRSGTPARAGRRELAALLGPTRAKVLLALQEPHTTSGLARLIRISVSSTSEHAATLRSAGLIVSRRDGQAVEHRLTYLGRSLIHQQHLGS